MQAIVYRMDKQKSPTVQHRNDIQYPEINHKEKECMFKKMMCITESLC